MTKVYIITGYGYTTEKVYTDKAMAEAEAKKVNYNLACSGSNDTVGVREVELVSEG